ncbi:MAG TPA: NAD(P)/FAD-dependent oxidoreductase [Thermoanaerobaculia bacterium]|nr:NAD(P)/FAD-dependent oxidoreductase [Thermoanaerobaculia bacterium]
MNSDHDVVIVGSGPNGFATGITMARAGLRVVIVEASDTTGGGMRSAELTLPGFIHDICSAIHPTALSSRFFRSIPLEKFGLEWIDPEYPLAHALTPDHAVVMQRSVVATAERLGKDGPSYRRLFEPLLKNPVELFDGLLSPLKFPDHPLQLARFGFHGLQSATMLARRFTGDDARALFAGCAAHAILPLESAATASFGLVLALGGHAFGWPCARRGSQSIANALEAYYRELGGEIVTSHRVTDLKQYAGARAILLDLTPKQIVTIAKDELPDAYRRRLERYRYGPGVFKVDWALSDPIPWRDPECLKAATVHVGGTFEEVAISERDAWAGIVGEKPFVLVVQQSLFDPTRAPAGKHTGWAYCHVPNGCTEDMTERIEKQIERFAPGFRQTILAKHILSPAGLETHNENYVGGDIAGGSTELGQLFARPVLRLDPYSTPNPRLFICSSSTPPGGGVHGMCGYFAASSALRKVFQKRPDF